jgi:hypothetical protein
VSKRLTVLLSALAVLGVPIASAGSYLAVDHWDLFGLDGAWVCDQFESKTDAQAKLVHELRHHDQGSIRNLDPDGNGRACDGWNHKTYDGYLSRTPPPLRPGEPTDLTRKVVRQFKAATGETLLMDKDLSDADVQYLGLGDPNSEDDLDWTAVDQRLAEEFGVFTIYVATRGATVADILPSGPDGQPQEPDEDGIYWEVHEDDSTQTLTYWAVKPYGNVVLSWISPRVGYPELDDTFWKLDRVLSAFEQ